MKTFLSRQEALNAGFVPARAKFLCAHRGFAICIRDTSPRDSRGFSYGIHLQSPRCGNMDEIEKADAILARQPDYMEGGIMFARTQTLSLKQERNVGGGIGSYSEMFDGQEYLHGIAAAKAWIDHALSETAAVSA